MKLIRILLVVGAALLISVAGCGDDNGSGNVDVDAECSRELCATNDALKTVCIDEFNDCVAKGGDPGQCIAAAVETCTI